MKVRAIEIIAAVLIIGAAIVLIVVAAVVAPVSKVSKTAAVPKIVAHGTSKR